MTRRSVDPSRLASLVSRPGIDPRVHLTLGVVDRVLVDPEHGVFADITYLLHEDNDTATVGTAYAGDRFGQHVPLQVEDTVLIAIPEGDTDAGPVIISRMWSAADKPFTEQQGTALTGEEAGLYEQAEKVILRCKPSTPYEIYVSEGANITIKVEGSGNANVVVDSGKVFLSDVSGTEPAAKGQTLKTYLDSLKAWADNHGHSVVTAGPGTYTTTSPMTATTPPPTPSPSPTVPDVRATKVELK